MLSVSTAQLQWHMATLRQLTNRARVKVNGDPESSCRCSWSNISPITYQPSDYIGLSEFGGPSNTQDPDLETE
jgi:hypothetical protein